MSRKELSATHHAAYGSRLFQITEESAIPTRWRDTPIESLIAAHNFEKVIPPAENPKLMIVTCIEYRFNPQVPHSFAYVVRKAGGRLLGSEFALAYTLAKGVEHVVLIGHNDCGMTKVEQAKPMLIDALVNQGWDHTAAALYVKHNAPKYMIADEIDALEAEYLRLTKLFKKVEIAPLFVSIASTHLHLPTWYLKYMNTDPSAETGPVDLDNIAELLNL